MLQFVLLVDLRHVIREVDAVIACSQSAAQAIVLPQLQISTEFEVDRLPHFVLLEVDVVTL